MIVLADEISPDTCRLWDLNTNDKMDKDRFRRDLGNTEEAYREVARRLGVLPNMSVVETARKQGRAVWAYLQAATEARTRQEACPKLLAQGP